MGLFARILPTVACPACHGNGWTPYQGRDAWGRRESGACTCIRCEGTGYADQTRTGRRPGAQPRPHDIAHPAPPLRDTVEPCHACGGTGIERFYGLYPSEVCDRCKGTKQITVKRRRL